MIGKLFGKIDSIYEDHLIIEVSNVGYQVFYGSNNLAKLTIGEYLELFIETHVREDRIQLFGFKNYVEKKTFLALQNVSGIGPKLALTISAFLTSEQLYRCLANKDINSLKLIPGVGTKMAERMLIELKDKFESFVKILPKHNLKTVYDNDIKNDAISALLNLGIDRHQANNLVTNIIEFDPTIKLDQLITQALKKSHKL